MREGGDKFGIIVRMRVPVVIGFGFFCAAGYKVVAKWTLRDWTGFGFCLQPGIH